MKKEFQLYIADYWAYTNLGGASIAPQAVTGRSYREAVKEAKRLIPEIRRGLNNGPFTKVVDGPKISSVRRIRVRGFRVSVEPLEKMVE